MKTKFVKQSDPILKKIAKEIPDQQISSEETRYLIETMLNVTHGQQKNKKRPIMVGLAAPQIGISKRIILVDVKANGTGKVGDLRICINPQIIWKSKKEVEWYEGCFSTGRVCGIVKRSISIKIRAYFQVAPWLKSHLNIREEKWSGYVARIFQHEIDHLNGRVFVDHITNPDNLHWVKKSEFPLYRNKQVWRTWPKKCSFERWERLKNPLLKKA